LKPGWSAGPRQRSVNHAHQNSSLYETFRDFAAMPARSTAAALRILRQGQSMRDPVHRSRLVIIAHRFRPLFDVAGEDRPLKAAKCG